MLLGLQCIIIMRYLAIFMFLCFCPFFLFVRRVLSSFFKKSFFLSDTLTCPILGPLVPLFWISGDVSSGFQSQSGFCLIRVAEVNVMYISCDPPLVLHVANLPFIFFCFNALGTDEDMCISVGTLTLVTTGEQCSSPRGKRSKRFRTYVCFLFLLFNYCKHF